MSLIDWELFLQDVERLELARLGSLRTLSLCRNSYKGKSTRDIKDPVSGLGVLEKILLDVAGLQKLSMLTISDQDQDITLARFALIFPASLFLR